MQYHDPRQGCGPERVVVHHSGLTGAKGNDGEPGRPGDKGDPGEKGDTGERGPVGPMACFPCRTECIDGVNYTIISVPTEQGWKDLAFCAVGEVDVYEPDVCPTGCDTGCE